MTDQSVGGAAGAGPLELDELPAGAGPLELPAGADLSAGADVLILFFDSC